MEVYKDSTPEYIKRKNAAYKQIESLKWMPFLPLFLEISSIVTQFFFLPPFLPDGLLEYLFGNLVKTYSQIVYLVPAVYYLSLAVLAHIVLKRVTALIEENYGADNGYLREEEIKSGLKRLKIISAALIFTPLVCDICCYIQFKDFMTAVVGAIIFGTFSIYEAILGISGVLGVKKAERILFDPEFSLQKSKKEKKIDFKKRKIYGYLGYGTAILLFLIVFGGGFFLKAGNPITYFKVNSDVRNFIKTNYPEVWEEAPKIDVQYSLNNKDYYVRISFYTLKINDTLYWDEKYNMRYDNKGKLVSENFTRRFSDKSDLFNRLYNFMSGLMSESHKDYKKKFTADKPPFEGYEADFFPDFIDGVGQDNLPEGKFDLDGDDEYLSELAEQYIQLQLNVEEPPPDMDTAYRITKEFAEFLDRYNIPYHHVNVCFGSPFVYETVVYCNDLTREDLHGENLKEILIEKTWEHRKSMQDILGEQ